jgi:hypothetical protein
MPLPGLLLGTFLVLTVVAAVLAAHRSRGRQHALAAFALERGLAFELGRDAGVDRRYPHHSCFRQGSDRYAYNRLHGRLGSHRIEAFDYHYATHSTDSKGRRTTHHHHFSALAVEASPSLKPLLIRPEGLLDKLAGFFGFDDIDFESEEFSRRFHVKAPDRRWAYDVLHPRAIEMLLAAPLFQIELAPGALVVRRSRCFTVPELAAALQTGIGLLDGLPAYVREALDVEG